MNTWLRGKGGGKVKCKVIYRFKLTSESPFYFGDSRKDQLVKNSQGEPLLLGNSIGGALRDYLEQLEVNDETILKYMGGVKKEKPEERFIPSSIYISDGVFEEGKPITIQGTKINPFYGAAEDKMKYSAECLASETKLSFTIEGDFWTGEEDGPCLQEFEKLIGTWARGFASGQLLFGGKKNNGFGRLKLVDLTKKVFPLDNQLNIDKYIFARNTEKEQKVDINQLEFYESSKEDKVVFFLEGQFPYGLYQNYKLKSDEVKEKSDEVKEESDEVKEELDGIEEGVTGVQQIGGSYVLPASSLKGVVKNELRLLITRITDDYNQAVEKSEELLGGAKCKGKVAFFDIEIQNVKKVKIVKFSPSNGQGKEPIPIYIKIDRLTGGNYQSALLKQQEIQGKAEIRLELSQKKGEDIKPFIFPLLYILRRIGVGLVPLGGRTSIGLGQFFSDKVSFQLKGKELVLPTGELSEEQRRLFKDYFEAFKRWCNP